MDTNRDLGLVKGGSADASKTSSGYPFAAVLGDCNSSVYLDFDSVVLDSVVNGRGPLVGEHAAAG
jgi:hypothetical protein